MSAGGGLSMAVAVIGDTLLDVYWEIEKTEWDDAAGGWAYSVCSERSCPGGAANVAAAVRSLEREAELVSIIGDDAAGSVVSGLLQRCGVGLEHLSRAEGYETPVLTRLLGLESGSVRVDRVGGEHPGRRAGGSLNGLREALGRCAAAVVSDYGRVVTPAVAREAIFECRRRGVPLIVDPSPGSALWFEGATAFKLNRQEARQLLGDDSAPPEALASRICRRFSLDFAIVTNGADGAIVTTGDGDVLHAREETPCVNATGGGDVVAASMAAFLADGFGLADSLAAAVGAASRAVQTECTCSQAPCLSQGLDLRQCFTAPPLS